jgi:hypothetical protein
MCLRSVTLYCEEAIYTYFIRMFMMYPNTTFLILCYSCSLIPSTNRNQAYISTATMLLISQDNLSRDSSDDLATDYGLVGRGSISGRGKRFFSSPQHPDRPWSPPSLLSNGYWWLFPRMWSGRGVNLTTHLHLVPRSRMVNYTSTSPYVFTAWWLIN